ncbi:MAG: DUF1571 domain-containing protein, partial [Myxococcota bacterium]
RTISEEITIKFRKPRTLYVAQVKPRSGQEVIYDPRRDPDELLAHPGRFPDFTVSLDIYGSYSTKDQHHPISHIDFGYTIAVIRRMLAAADGSPHGEVVQWLGQKTLKGKRVNHIRIEGGDAPWRRVRARDDESVFAFADRVGSDAYVVFYNNPDIRKLTSELDEDETYLVPPYYSPKLDLWFDEETGMLHSLEARDYQGRLYERFNYIKMVPNAPLTDRDFDPDNPDYDF